VLPFYVLHEPVIVAAAWIIIRVNAPIMAKYAALVIASFTITLILYETLVRRFRVPRFLFGMKPPSPEPGHLPLKVGAQAPQRTKHPGIHMRSAPSDTPGDKSSTPMPS
jgi:peptidoglycan/LPS O-acetylase OafA/YrhL